MISMVPNRREKKGICIAVSGDSIRKLGKNVYVVKSQTGNGWYKVTKTPDADVWVCECPDFSYRLIKAQDKRCKHIIAIQTLQYTFETANKIQKIERPKICPRCFSTEVVRTGFRIVKGGIKRQRFRCKKCDRRFILGENGFSKVSSDPKIITEALNLIFSGMSYRNVAKHLKLAYGRHWSHVTIIYWVRKYTEIIQQYVNTLKPELGQVWHTDEIMLNVKGTEPTGVGFYDWCWNVLDGQTRYVLASEISKRRELNDARNAFAKGKQHANGMKPSYIVTDSLQSYRRAFIKEFNARTTAHIKTKAFSEGFGNRPIERYHNELRSVVKNRRGLGNDETAQKFVDGFRVYRNFAREHTGLPNKETPAEAASINLGLGENKLENLLKQSAIAKELKPEEKFKAALGKRLEKVEVIDEKDCIKVKPKGWLGKEQWKEINNILRTFDFAWLSNGRDSLWLKPLS